MDGKGDGAKACRHAGEDDHAGSFAALLAKDAAEDWKYLAEIILVRDIGAFGEESVAPKDCRCRNEGEEGGKDGADCGSGDAHRRDGADAEDQDEVQDDVDDISCHIRLHDDSRLAIAKLHGLEDQRQ